MLWAIILLTIGLAGSLAALAILSNRNATLRAKLEESQNRAGGLQSALDSAQGEVKKLFQENSDLNTSLGRQDEANKQMLVQHEAAQKQARDTFDATAANALGKATEQFLELAKKTFAGEQKDANQQLELRKTEIKGLLDPVALKLDEYNRAVTAAESDRKQAYGKLSAELVRMTSDQGALRQETANLVKALRRPEGRGRWGEMQLRRVAELAGMIDRCDFEEQVTMQSAGGALRPDMVVRLPSDRIIVIDSKTPLDAFLDASDATDDARRTDCLDRHARQMQDKIKSLASKPYRQQFERTVDFVVMFIPGEGFLSAAVERDPGMIESAMEKGVIIATPTTLISLLKVIALGWREEKIAEHAQKISELGRELHDRVCTALLHAQKVGTGLNGAIEAYNKFIGSVETRVLPGARQLEELGAGSSKELPDIKPIQEVARALKNPTLAPAEIAASASLGE